MTAAKETEFIKYDLLENGIHRIELKVGSPAAINVFLSIIDEIICTATDNDVKILRTLIIVSPKQMPSFQDLASRAKKVIAKHPDRPRFRNAYLLHRGFMANLLQIFVTTVVQRNGDRMKFYQIDKYDAAVEWLLAPD